MFYFFRNPKNRSLVIYGTTCGACAILTATSAYLRVRREEMLADIPSALSLPRSRTPASLVQLIERASLMGDEVNVLSELEDIRLWHVEKGFKGGVVLRELTVPLYQHPTEDNNNNNNNSSQDSGGTVSDLLVPLNSDSNLTLTPHVSPDHDARHCYYLYYERKSDGHLLQQVFCRGTTLIQDVITDLKALYVYDEELQCYLHMGFRDHANLLLDDLEPLLVSKDNPRATVEMCGHSLGGAVAVIVSLKLRKRGYRVTRLTTFGAPRICDSSSVLALTKLLPPDALRVEDASDIIPLLPFRGDTLGDKLWLLAGNAEKREHSLRDYKFISKDLKAKASVEWIDSFLYNFHVPEIFMNTNIAHRTASYTTKLRTLEKLATDIQYDADKKKPSS